MSETFVGVLAALVVYRGLAILGAEALRAWLRRDIERTMARSVARWGSGSWIGERSRPWRLMRRLGIEEARR